VGDICRWSPERIRQVIRESNQQSVKGSQKYVMWENSAIRTDYEFIECPCDESCWCKRNSCTGHYRIREIAFDQFLETYGKPGLIVLDPPRSGTLNEIKKTINAYGARKVLYLSCNPVSLAFDLKQLTEAYRVACIQPFDMLPHTHHIETLVLLEKICVPDLPGQRTGLSPADFMMLSLISLYICWISGCPWRRSMCFPRTFILRLTAGPVWAFAGDIDIALDVIS
jgi:hypothetical protein